MSEIFHKFGKQFCNSPYCFPCSESIRKIPTKLHQITSKLSITIGNLWKIVACFLSVSSRALMLSGPSSSQDASTQLGVVFVVASPLVTSLGGSASWIFVTSNIKMMSIVEVVAPTSTVDL